MTLKFRIPKRTSFRTRLFIVMIGMLVIAGLMILGTTTIQYESQRENYHLGRLTRKEIQIIRHIDYLAEKHNLINKPFEVWNEFSSDFEKINTIHNIQYSLFNLEGNPLFIYHSPLEVVANNYNLSRELLQKIKSSKDGSYIEHYKSEIDNFHASYKILRDDLNRAYAILFFPYFEDISFSENELKRSQDLKKGYFDTGQFYWGTKKKWLTSKNLHLGSIGFKIPSWRIIDIDEISDWRKCYN